MSNEQYRETPEQLHEQHEQEVGETLIPAEEHEVQEVQTELPEEREEKIAEKKASIQEEIEQSLQKKDTGEEEFSSTPVETPEAPREKENWISKKWKKVMLTLGLAAAVSTPGFAKNDSKDIEDSLSKKEYRVTNEDEGEKPFEQIIAQEKIGHITIEGRMLIPQADTTKEVYAFYFSDDGKSKNSLGEFMAAMQRKGYTPADGILLEQIYMQNKDVAEFNKKAKWLLAPVPATDGDDTRASEKMIVTEKDGTVKYVIPQNAVFPTKTPQGLGRYEISEGVPNDTHGFVFYKVKEKKTAQFQEGVQ